MIWALIFSLIFGGGDDVFFIPKMEKYIKRHVDNKVFVREIVSFRKEAKKDRKKFQQERKKFVKAISRLNSQRDAKRDDFYIVAKNVLQKRRVLQLKEIETLLLMRKYISEEEWNNVLKDSEKDLKKFNENGRKAMRSLEKRIIKLEKSVENEISDKARLEELKKQISEYRFQLIEKTGLFYSYSDNKDNAIMNYFSDKESLQEVVDTVNKYRIEVYEAFVETHFSLAEATTEKEWDKVIRKMNKVF